MTEKIERPTLAIEQGKIHDVQHWPNYWALDLLDWIEHLEGDLGALVRAGKRMLATHGMHGPCEHNSCTECDSAYVAMRAALRDAQEPKP